MLTEAQFTDIKTALWERDNLIDFQQGLEIRRNDRVCDLVFVDNQVRSASGNGSIRVAIPESLAANLIQYLYAETEKEIQALESKIEFAVKGNGDDQVRTTEAA